MSAGYADASKVVLIVGLLFSVLVAIVVYLALVARIRSRQLHESALQLETLFQNLPGMAYRSVGGPSRTMEFVSDGCQVLSGYSRSDFEAQRHGGHACSWLSRRQCGPAADETVARRRNRARCGDRGCDVSADVATMLSTPFSTTKESGLGMGLSISRAIITAHGGHLDFLNNEYSGATLIFTLPAAQQED